MEREDFEPLVVPGEHSPSDNRNRKLKRLKKAFEAPKSPVFDSLLQDDEVESPQGASKSLDSTKSGGELRGSEHRSGGFEGEENLFDSVLQDVESRSPESSLKSLDWSKSGDEMHGSEHKSAVFEREKESEEFDQLFPWEGERAGAKRALDFGPDDGDSSDGFDMNLDSEKQGSKVVVGDKKGNRKRVKSSGCDGEKKEGSKKKKGDKSAEAAGKPKVSKRKEKQERKAEVEFLVDYQRQLRERRDVAFKPLSAVQKPVSSVLERIRQRKLQVSIKAAVSISNQLSDSLGEIMRDSDSDDVVIVKKEDSKGASVCKDQSDPIAIKVDRPSSSPAAGSDEDLAQFGDGHNSCEMPLAEDMKPSAAFRPPTNDTQELFSESQASDTQDDNSKVEMGSSQDEDLVAPSLPSMNLKLDSVPLDDISSEEDEDDEEENDKENINPVIGQLFKRNLSPKGDPVKDFLDEEAVEEDCSDDDRRRFDDEGEDDSDAEEIAEMIATNYTEKSVDRERRNELHQMWLAQQDEAGTENLLQRLQCKANQTDITLLDEEDEGQNSYEMDDELDDDDPPTNPTRLSTKQLREMIPQMFTDKDDVYVSSDDEETERSLNKQRLLGKLEIKEQAVFASPVENGVTREVFGRIKKLNLVPETKKKVKTSSIFQNLVKKGPDSNSSKSSFLNRMSSIPVSSRRSSNTVKAFIFGRDDSNSRSSFAALEEDSRDAMKPAENSSQRKRTFTAKFSSQARQSTQVSAETSHSTSLIDILKRSSVQTSHLARDNSMVDHQAAFAAFKPSKRLVKVEVRS